MARWILLFATMLISACTARPEAPIAPHALGVGDSEVVFMGTNRAANGSGGFGHQRSERTTFTQVLVSVPSQRAAGQIPVSDSARHPERHFLIAQHDVLSGAAGFRSKLAQRLAKRPDAERDVTVYIHGYNNTYSDAAFRIAQLRHDLELPGEVVAFAWPSRAHTLGYQYDDDSSLYARDGLEEMLRLVNQTGARRITLVAHSMGSFLLMETLRQMEIADPGWAARNLDAVVLISPDISTAVFREQAHAFRELPQPFVIFVSKVDRALQLSARLRLSRDPNADRLGTLEDPRKLADLPVTIIDVTAFSETGGHFAPGNSPALLSLFNRGRQLDADFLRGTRRTTGILPGTTRVVDNASHTVIRHVPGFR